MKYSILGFNQQKVAEANLDITDLLLLNYIIDANGIPSMRHIVKNEISYVWLSHKKIQEDLPVLKMSEGTLRNRISKLKTNGYIISETISNNKSRGSMTYYSITELTVSFLDDMVEQPCHLKMTSNNSTNNIDYTINSNKNNKLLSNDNNNYLQNSKNELFETEIENKQYASSKKKRGKSLYQKCVDYIDEYTDIPELKDVLIEYLKFRLSVTDKPIYGINQWKSMLKKLDKVVEECKKDYVDVVQQSIDRAWLSFYPIAKKSDYNKDVFAEGDEVSYKHTDTTEEERKENLEKQGKRTEF